MENYEAVSESIMAKVLCVWEQGGNFSHLSNLRVLIQILLQQGHAVYLAARQLHGIPAVFGDMPIHYLQAPFKQNVASASQASFLSYAYMLQQQCFSSAEELAIYVRVWRSMFDMIKPDMVIYEHSPTALVASLDYTFRKVLVGNGFMCPPVTDSPFGVFPTTKQDVQTVGRLRNDDTALLQLINVAQRRMGLPVVERLADLYAQVDCEFLQTFEELDHFDQRMASGFLGIWSLPCNVSPQWPAGGQAKVFGYLQVFPKFEQLLQDLLAANVSALLYVRGLPRGIRDKYSCERLSFTDQLVDLRQVAEQADFVVTHGNHATLGYCMLMGIPQLAIPRYQEQLFPVLRLQRLGCALMAYQDQPDFQKEIGALLQDAGFKEKASMIKMRYEHFDVRKSEQYMAEKITELLQHLIVTV